MKDAPKWMKDSIIILGNSGSYAYGTETPESDRDYLGVCVPPVNYYLGLNSFNEYRNNKGKNFKNTKDDVDYNVLHINKFIQNAMEGVPQAIELLFQDEEDYIILTDLGKKIVDNRHLFLTKKIFPKLMGFSKSQTHRIFKVGEDEGYDSKAFYHSMRLLTSGIEIFETGDYRTKRPNKEFLMKCRNKEFPVDVVKEMLEEYTGDLKETFKNSSLPDKPDFDKIDRLLMDVNTEFLGLERK